MNRLFYSFLLILIAKFGSGQSFQNRSKPVIDTAMIATWTRTNNCSLSNDGNYVIYPIRKNYQTFQLVIKAIDDRWQKIVSDVNDGVFTDDSRIAIVKAKDSLCLITLGSSQCEYIPNVISFRMLMIKGEEWLSYQLSGSSKEVIFRNMKNGLTKSFNDIFSYDVSNNNKTLLLISKIQDGEVLAEILELNNIENPTRVKIWVGKGASGFVFDTSGTRLAFIVEELGENNQKIKSLWYYKKGETAATKIIDDRSPQIANGLQIDRILSPAFTKDGSRMFFSLKEIIIEKSKPGIAKVDVWSYTDPKLQSQQIKEISPKSLFAIVDIKKSSVIQLQERSEKIQTFPSNDDVVVVNGIKGDHSESYWNKEAECCRSQFLVSTKSGRRLPIPKIIVDISPLGKFLICGTGIPFDDYYAYDIETENIYNITKLIPGLKKDEKYNRTAQGKGLEGVAMWSTNDEWIYIYDRYDIWKVDPKGIKSPICVSKRYGSKNNLVLRIVAKDAIKVLSGKETLILHAFNRTNKEAGFYNLDLTQNGTPELLTMGPYSYNGAHSYMLSGKNKARDVDKYLVQRCNASESKNYFLTTDFKTFKDVTQLHPEAGYNWLTTELIEFKNVNGKMSKGILYKPENFDPKKKYPVIIHYYDNLSDDKNDFKEPALINDNINIPFAVSNGYVVFEPDINYTIGSSGESALNYVVSAAKHLSKTFQWIDSKHIGIHGHSFGGYETNYIVSHTTIFAAACSGAGVSDMISEAGLTWGVGNSKQEYTELRGYNMLVPLWDNPIAYLKASPLLSAKKVTTPILMMNNHDDGAVAFSQGLEFFIALRRLGKLAWMLQYDGEGHSLSKNESKLDYTIRMMQFFDHYLKGVRAPKWMTQGIPASRKGIDNGYGFDTEIQTPKASPLLK